MQRADLQRQQQHAASVTIIRDDFGVPHIYGKTDADTVFGLMYAQAEDDFPRVERNYYWAIGRLAEVEGEQALFSDLRARLYMTEAEARAFYATAPDWLQALCQAWADGLNYYLHTHPQVQPRLLTHFEPWMTMYFFEGSIGGDIEQIPLAGIESFYGAHDDTAVAWQPLLKHYDDEPRGSNGFAIAGELTASGHTMLLINPHTSFYFRGEVHMVSEQGLQAYGAVTWGQFFIYQGFNEKCGWMHTSSRADAIDYYYETIIKKEGKLYYEYGDQLVPVIERTVSLKFKDGEDISTREFKVFYTHNGPVIREENGKWISIRLMVEHEKALTQSYLRTKA
ncbi:MAG: penicillin acylase family protein, partial [Gammaproteobacteria bacterium]|nr:penicillin acylase family protein [Gammaproteobacteria bacterium]